MSRVTDPICVVGIGCCTAVGNDVLSTAAAVRAGIAGFSEHPFMISQDGEPYILAIAPAVDPSIIGATRLVELAKHGVVEACQPVTVMPEAGAPMPVFVGLPEHRPGVDHVVERQVADAVADSLAAVYAVGEIRILAKGHSAGLMAIDSAADMLRRGKADFCLAGGVDSYIDPDTLDWVEDNEQLHKPDNAWGFIPGEAAAFCLLCREATAISRGLPVLTRLVAITTAVEQNCIKTETVCIGEGLTEAVAGVLRDLPRNQKIEFTYCDQNGEAYRANEFGFMLARLGDRFESPDAYGAPADCWGDVGAASGPLYVMLHSIAEAKRNTGGELSLIWTSSEGGERGAAVVGSKPVDVSMC